MKRALFALTYGIRKPARQFAENDGTLHRPGRTVIITEVPL